MGHRSTPGEGGVERGVHRMMQDRASQPARCVLRRRHRQKRRFLQILGLPAPLEETPGETGPERRSGLLQAA